MKMSTRGGGSRCTSSVQAALHRPYEPGSGRLSTMRAAIRTNPVGAFWKQMRPTVPMERRRRREHPELESHRLVVSTRE